MSPMLSSGVKTIWLLVIFDEISIIQPKVGKLGLIVTLHLASVRYPSSKKFRLIYSLGCLFLFPGVMTI